MSHRYCQHPSPSSSLPLRQGSGKCRVSPFPQAESAGGLAPAHTFSVAVSISIYLFILFPASLLYVPTPSPQTNTSYYEIFGYVVEFIAVGFGLVILMLAHWCEACFTGRLSLLLFLFSSTSSLQAGNKKANAKRLFYVVMCVKEGDSFPPITTLLVPGDKETKSALGIAEDGWTDRLFWVRWQIHST